MEVYGDLVNHPAFAAGELEQMKARVAAGIDSRDAAWDNQAFRYFKRQYYGPLHLPYQFDALGTRENLARFGPADLRKWYAGKILAVPRVLAIFGDVDKQTAVAMARKFMGEGKLPPAPPTAFPPLVLPQAPGTPTVNVQRVAIQPTQQQVAGVVIGFESKSQIGEPAEATLTVAQCLAGGFSYPTGYIFEILRGRGLVYEAGAFNQPGRDANLPGTFITYAGCDPKNVKEVVDVILESIARLQGSEQDIQADWFTRSRDMITTAEALETETPAEQATQAATDELFGLGYDYHAGFAARIDAVSLPQIQSIARNRLRNCVVTICTPDPDRAQIATGARTYSTFSPVDLTPRGIQHDVVGK
jgi:zinc protease